MSADWAGFRSHPRPLKSLTFCIYKKYIQGVESELVVLGCK